MGCKQRWLDQDQGTKAIRALNGSVNSRDAANTMPDADHRLSGELLQASEKIVAKLFPIGQRFWRAVTPQRTSMDRYDTIIIKQWLESVLICLGREAVRIGKINERLPRILVKFINSGHDNGIIHAKADKGQPLMKMMVLRIGIILTLILIVALPYSVHGDQLSIDDCNESQLETILTRAQNGDRISFNCSGLILITRPKIIDRNILLDGTAQQVTLSGNDAQQVFVVNANASLTLSTLTIIGGQRDRAWGGIFNLGTMIVAPSNIRHRQHSTINASSLTVSESSFIDNQGDGIYNSGTLTVKRSTFVRNKHGIDNASGEVEIINSTFVANQAPPGQICGAIANADVLTIVGSTFADNVASGGG